MIDLSLVPIDWVECRKIISKIRKANSIILDVGCGDGKKTKYVVGDNAFLLISLDRSFSKLKKAKGKNIRPVLGDLKSLPFKDKTFDIVMCYHVIEHVNKIDGLFFLCEVYRILRKGGYLLLVTPNAKRITLFYRLLGVQKYLMNPDHVFEYSKHYYSYSGNLVLNFIFYLYSSAYISKKCISA